ncbi:hypothetical protein V6N11_042706 [Hibiscus sabdariffa]|uniref:Uncharacterized protein n=1 Tax=Hibiscus sabdariffa TaxID=183260 RepID=A0ABR2QX37_9ROSI
MNKAGGNVVGREASDLFGGRRGVVGRLGWPDSSPAIVTQGEANEVADGLAAMSRCALVGLRVFNHGSTGRGYKKERDTYIHNH